jgi:hypothetical protein
VLIGDALPLFRIAIVRFILPLARLERIALGMLRRFRLMMKCLRKPVGIAASRSSSRRKKNHKRAEHNHNPGNIPNLNLQAPQVLPASLPALCD